MRVIRKSKLLITGNARGNQKAIEMRSGEGLEALRQDVPGQVRRVVGHVHLSDFSVTKPQNEYLDGRAGLSGRLDAKEVLPDMLPMLVDDHEGPIAADELVD